MSDPARVWIRHGMRTALRPTASLRPTALVGLAILGSDWCNITDHLTLAGLLVRLLSQKWLWGLW
jgi:hypothetical protein